MQTFVYWMLFAFLVLPVIGQQEQCPVSREDFKEAKPVQAELNSNVILPCVTTFDINVNDHILEWIKNKDEIYVVRNTKQEFPRDDYKDRASAQIKELKNNDASLTLSGVKETDAGEYCCCIRLDNQDIKCTTVILNLTQLTQMTAESKNVPKDDNFTQKAGVISSVVFVCTGLVVGCFALWRRRSNRRNIGDQEPLTPLTDSEHEH